MTTRAPSPARVAEALLDLWTHLMRDGGHQVVQVIEDLDLSLTQVKLLGALACAQRDPSVKGLSEGVGCSLPNASRAVDALQRRGLVERREDADDRRVKRLSITPAGREAVERITTARLAGLEAFAASLSPDERAGLHAVITSLPHAKDVR